MEHIWEDALMTAAVASGATAPSPCDPPRRVCRSRRKTPMNTAEIKDVARSRYGAFAETGEAQGACCPAMAQPASRP